MAGDGVAVSAPIGVPTAAPLNVSAVNELVGQNGGNGRGAYRTDLSGLARFAQKGGRA